MGQGRSSNKSGKGLGAAAVADGATAVDCGIRGRVRALADAVPGVGQLRRSGADVVVVSDGSLLAVCDPSDALTARLSGCLNQDFEYIGTVKIESGTATVDVGPVP